MEDISPKLLEDLMSEFEKRYRSNGKIQAMIDKISKGTDYNVANQYSLEVGDLLAEVLRDKISSDILPQGKMFYNIATKTVSPMLENNYELISNACMSIQTSLNKSSGLGLSVIAPDVNQDRIDGLINIISGPDNYDEIKYILDESIPNFSQSIVDDFIRENASFQSKSGLSPKITRTAIGKCCKWCLNLAGTYNYEDVSDTRNDVFRRHSNCRCLVTYHPITGKVQNSHTKRILNKTELTELEYMKQFGIKEKNIQVENNRKVIGLKINNVRINGLSNHLNYRMINRNVSISEVLDTIKNPLKCNDVRYDKKGLPSFKVIGKYVTICINPDTGIITTTYKTGSKISNKLQGKVK